AEQLLQGAVFRELDEVRDATRGIDERTEGEGLQRGLAHPRVGVSRRAHQEGATGRVADVSERLQRARLDERGLLRGLRELAQRRGRLTVAGRAECGRGAGPDLVRRILQRR